MGEAKAVAPILGQPHGSFYAFLPQVVSAVCLVSKVVQFDSFLPYMGLAQGAIHILIMKMSFRWFAGQKRNKIAW